MKHLLLAVSLILLLSGCARSRSVEPPALSGAERAQRGQLKSVDLKIPRAQLLKALQLGAPTNNIRLVPVFRGAGGSSSTQEPPPEYRFFDVKPHSAYALLGIQNNDILISAEDHVVYKPENFPEYVRRLLEVQRGWIEIRRGGESLLLQFSMQ